jgi:hypothetical protein
VAARHSLATAGGALAALLLLPCAAQAQTDTQLWANFTLDWNRSRNTLDEPFTTTDHVIDLTMKRAW